MARTFELSDNDLDSIAAQVAESLPQGLEDFVGQLEIAETFEVWSLMRVSATSIDQAVEKTEALHHQLFAGNRPVGYARSWRERPGLPPQVDEVVQSPLAAKIEAALEMADPMVADDVEARLLFADQYHICVMWFDDPQKRCFVVSAPSKVISQFPTGPLIDGADFLQRLQQAKPIRGLKLDRSTPSA